MNPFWRAYFSDGLVKNHQPEKKIGGWFCSPSQTLNEWYIYLHAKPLNKSTVHVGKYTIHWVYGTVLFFIVHQRIEWDLINGPLSCNRAIRYSGFWNRGPFSGSDRWRFLGYRVILLGFLYPGSILTLLKDLPTFTMTFWFSKGRPLAKTPQIEVNLWIQTKFFLKNVVVCSQPFLGFYWHWWYRISEPWTGSWSFDLHRIFTRIAPSKRDVLGQISWRLVTPYMMAESLPQKCPEHSGLGSIPP